MSKELNEPEQLFLSFISEVGSAVVSVSAKPSSPQNKIISFDSDNKKLRVTIKAQPENGKANQVLIKYLKKITKKEIKLISGATSKKKLVKIY